MKIYKIVFNPKFVDQIDKQKLLILSKCEFLFKNRAEELIMEIWGSGSGCVVCVKEYEYNDYINKVKNKRSFKNEMDW